MLVGATGAGKSTMINGIVNHIFNVKFDDDFRLKLICDESGKSQAHSQTSSVNAYTIHPLPGSRLDYTLTIVDTPGLIGDTRGLERDDELFEQIKRFFTRTAPDDEGIDHIHAIGFVAKSPDARLTSTQQYISDSVLSVFGKDIRENIFLVVTFADGNTPPVIEAVREAGFPFQKYFTFNNSALYSAEGAAVTSHFWTMGQNSFDTFFSMLQNYSSKSLTLTKEVLEERSRLKSYVKTLRDEITKGVNQIDEMEKIKEMLEANERQITAHKDFTIEVDVTKQRKVNLRPGTYVTNCLVCNRTCHESCVISSESQKYRCAVMTDRTPQAAHCTVCEKRCSWKDHCNNPYKFEVYQETERKTFEELKKQYDTAIEGKELKEVMVKSLEEDHDALHMRVLGLINQVKVSLQRLGEIALKPNRPLSKEAYIDLLIQEERLEGKTGFEKRIQTFEKLKLDDRMVQDISAADTAADNPAHGERKRWYHFWKWGKQDELNVD